MSYLSCLEVDVARTESDIARVVPGAVQTSGPAVYSIHSPVAALKKGRKLVMFLVLPYFVAERSAPRTAPGASGVFGMAGIETGR